MHEDVVAANDEHESNVSAQKVANRACAARLNQQAGRLWPTSKIPGPLCHRLSIAVGDDD